MSESLADQLKAALAASQARANKGTPERAALDILTEQINKLVTVVEKNEPKPEAQVPQPTGDPAKGWKGSIPPGQVLVSANQNSYSWWLRKAKVGDVYIASTLNRSAGYQSPFYAAAEAAKKSVKIERVVVVRGTNTNPTVETAVYVTCIEYNPNAKPVHNSGSAAGSES